jgi:phenylacetate-coenzyme A ligase PaaK-like adenylate-forming protein
MKQVRPPKIYRRLPYNALWLNISNLSIARLEEVATRIVRFQPAMLETSIAAITLLAHLVRDQRIEDIKPRLIQVGNEILQPEARQLITDTFQCSVFDHDSGMEVGGSAVECSVHHGLRVFAENSSPAGHVFYPAFFTNAFWELSGIYQFRITQHTLTDLQVQIVPGPGFEQAKAVAFLTDFIHRKGDPSFVLRFELCDQLPTATSGKFQCIISHVPSPHVGFSSEPPLSRD